jgi:hypothetical protein
MKLFKLGLLFSMAAAVMLFTGSAYAFHDGGVAVCDGCHTMHNSSKGSAMTVGYTGYSSASGKFSRTPNAALIGNAYLLKGSDASSTCLNCHANSYAPTDTAHNHGYPVCTPGVNPSQLPLQRTPGGDFGWLQINNPNSSDVITAASGGTARHGHHIVAADFNFLADTNNGGKAPGSTSQYPSASLGCNSCHDPHSATRGDGSALPISMSGSYGEVPAAGTATGVFRLLAGNGYTLGGTPTTFANDAPVAVAPSTYNASETTYTGTRVAYGQGMSEWCANCHDLMLNNNYTLGVNGGGPSADHKHPAGNSSLLATVLSDGSNPANIYNAYVNTGDKTGDGSAAYLSLVPYEMQSTDVAGTLEPAILSTAGPTGGENVMCLSCHRAHASGFDSGTRFDVSVEAFITDPSGAWAYRGSDYEPHPDASGYYTAAYYDRPAAQFGPSQRTLCNKCHGKD